MLTLFIVHLFFPNPAHRMIFAFIFFGLSIVLVAMNWRLRFLDLPTLFTKPFLSKMLTIRFAEEGSKAPDHERERGQCVLARLSQGRGRTHQVEPAARQRGDQEDTDTGLDRASVEPDGEEDRSVPEAGSRR
ncbi:hypothetical protein IH785_10970 [candidate division KSB1 bacterium]|nr:hypothetical protein [candidate division KSB1 bacterium]